MVQIQPLCSHFIHIFAPADILAPPTFMQPEINNSSPARNVSQRFATCSRLVNCWSPPLPMNCSEIVPHPVDVAPIRSPQAVHTAILTHVAGLDLVEIGTRNGDGMSCFCTMTRSAKAVELSPTYCSRLTNRASVVRAEGRPSFDVVCEDYKKAKGLDADVFTW